MDSKDFVQVGKVHSTQGLKGELFIMVFSGEFSWSSELEILALGDGDGAEPHTFLPVERLRNHRKKKFQGLAIKVKGKDRIEAVEEYVGLSVYVPDHFLTSQEGEAIFLREILGFPVEDKVRGHVGVVVGFLDNGAQDLIVVRHPSKEDFEVPLVEPILLKVDFENKVLLMDIPPGLVAGEEL